MKSFTTIFMLMAFVAQSGLAVTKTWVGPTGNWNDPAKWNPSGVPAPGDNVVLSSGTVTLDASAECSNLNLSGGAQIGGTAALTISGTLTWTNGKIGLDATTTGTVTVLGSAVLGAGGVLNMVLNAKQLVFDCAVAWSGGHIQMNNGAVLRLEAGRTLTVSHANSDLTNTAGTATFDNFGTVQKSSGGITIDNAIVFNHHGAAILTNCELEITGNSASDGTFDLAGASSNLHFNGGSHLLENAEIIGTGSVAHSFGSNSTFGTGTSVAPTVRLNLNGGTLTDNVGLTWLNVMVSGSAMYNGSGSPNTAGTLTLSGGTLGGSGTLTANGAVSVSSNSSVTFDTKTLVCAAGLTWSLGSMNLQNAAVLSVPAGQTFLVSHPGAALLQGTGGSVQLEGTLEKGTSGTLHVGANVNFVNTGAVHLTAGGFRLNSGAVRAGIWNLDGATTLFELTGAGIHVFENAVFSGSGTVRVPSTVGIVHFNAGTTVAPTLRLEIFGASVVRDNVGTTWASLDIDAGRIEIIDPNVTTTINGDMDWSAGKVGNGTGPNATLIVNGMCHMTGNSSVTRSIEGMTLRCNGGLDWSAGFLVLNHLGNLTLPVGATGTTPTISSSITNTAGVSGVFLVEGTLVKSANVPFLLGTGANFQNSGIVAVLDGHFTILGHFTNYGILTVQTPGEFVVSNGTFSNFGGFAPGYGGIGTMNMTHANLPLNRLDIEIEASADHDVLNTIGNLNIGGTSELNVAETQCVANGNYPIVTYTGTRTGTFGSLDLPPGYSVVYDDPGKKIELVYDDPEPVITLCPADIVTCQSSGIVIDDATATDNCPGVMVSNDAPPSFPGGTTLVTHTATDSKGQTATCVQTVEVGSGVPGDNDCDGISPANGDCDDNDATVFPGAPELCDMLDNDCDGTWNEGLTLNLAKVTGTIAHPTCFNGSDGSINITTTLGTAPYAWRWFGPNGFSSTAEDPSGLAAGTYFVVVDDNAAGRCPKKAKTFVVAGPTVTMASQAACGLTKGRLTLTIKKPSNQTVTQLWSTGATTTSISAVAGNYSVTLTLKLSTAPFTVICTHVMNGIIESAPAITLPSVSVSGTGPNATAIVNTSGGTPPITFSGKRTAPSALALPAQSSNTFSPLQAGTYRFDVVDNRGCKAFKTNIVVPSAFAPGGADERADFGPADSPDFEIFPNPIENQCFVRRGLSIFENSANLKTQVFDATGRLVFEKDWPDGAEMLALDFGNENPPGLYVIKILKENNAVLAVLRAEKM